jgi:hypothetical protein
MWDKRGGANPGEGTVVQASLFAVNVRTYGSGCEFGVDEVGEDDEAGRGDGDDWGSVTIAGTRIISSCSNVVASTTWSKDVCYHPDQSLHTKGGVRMTGAPR